MQSVHARVCFADRKRQRGVNLDVRYLVRAAGLSGYQRRRARRLAGIQSRQTRQGTKLNQLSKSLVDAIQTVTATDRNEDVSTGKRVLPELLENLEGDGFVTLDAIRIRDWHRPERRTRIPAGVDELAQQVV